MACLSKEDCDRRGIIIPLREIWSDLPPEMHLSRYQVSNLGNVRTKENNYVHKLTQRPDGYLIVHLTRDFGDDKTYQAYILVAMTFIPNPEGYPIVDHIDKFRFNN